MATELRVFARTSDHERFTRTSEACTSDRQPVNGNPDSYSYSYSCLCERSLNMCWGSPCPSTKIVEVEPILQY